MQSDLKVRLRHWSCSGCGGRCHSVPVPPSENLEEGRVDADGDAEAREGGQDDGDHGLHAHLLGLIDWLVIWFTHHSTA